MDKKSSINDLPKSQPSLTRPQPSDVENQEFQSVLSGKAETADGTPYSFNLYKSPDGRSVSTRFEMRKSRTSAEEELLRNVRAADEVIEQEPKIDSHGQQIGQRAVLKTKAKQSNKTQITVIWNDGLQLHFLETDSIQDALEFEKEYLRGPLHQ